MLQTHNCRTWDACRQEMRNAWACDRSTRWQPTTNAEMQYSVKTAHGISEEIIMVLPFSHFGTRQGSGASPAVWLTLVIVLLILLMAWFRKQCNSCILTLSYGTFVVIDACVDDTSHGSTDFGFTTLNTMINKLQIMAQTWKTLLFYSKGALNLSKFLWHIMYWDWKHGRQRTRGFNTNDNILHQTTQEGNHTGVPTWLTVFHSKIRPDSSVLTSHQMVTCLPSYKSSKPKPIHFISDSDHQSCLFTTSWHFIAQCTHQQQWIMCSRPQWIVALFKNLCKTDSYGTHH